MLMSTVTFDLMPNDVPLDLHFSTRLIVRVSDLLLLLLVLLHSMDSAIESRSDFTECLINKSSHDLY